MASEQTRARILQAAGELFAAQGYDGTTTRQVGGAAGVNVATLAYHFGGKEGLYEATLGAMYERLLALELPPDPGPDPATRVRTVMAAVWRFCRRESDAVRLLLRHVVDHGSLPAGVREAWGPRVLQRALDVQDALGLPPRPDRPLAMLTLNHLLARYAVARVEDLAPFCGARDPEVAIAEHLGDVAVALLLGDPPEQRP